MQIAHDVHSMWVVVSAFCNTEDAPATTGQSLAGVVAWLSTASEQSMRTALDLEEYLIKKTGSPRNRGVALPSLETLSLSDRSQ